MEYNTQNLEEHLNKEHKITAVSEYLKEIVYGGTDGIVTTFAVVAGFSGAQNSTLSNQLPIIAVLLFGLANLFADGTSMALGNFLSVRASKDVYKQESEKELFEIENSPKMEKQETVQILKNKGFSNKDANTLAQIYSKNNKYWVEFMMRDELDMPNPMNENAKLSALATFVSFVFFGIIPLIPYILFINSPFVFIISVVATFIALVLLGTLRWKVTKEGIMQSVGEVVLLGSVAAAIAYFVGSMFK
jgi:VIT1/CCC1 family predicted Fe2+/Mn2+ transporter